MIAPANYKAPPLHVVQMQRVLRMYPRTLDLTHTWKGEEIAQGLITTDHRDLIDLSDIRRKRVFVFGCGTGADCIWAMEKGAREVFGIDIDRLNIEVLRKLAEIVGKWYPDIFWRQADLGNGVPPDLLGLEYSTVICLSVIDRVGYRKLWAESPWVRVAYVGGARDDAFADRLLGSSEFSTRHLGSVPASRMDDESVRPIYRVARKRGR